MKALNTLLAQVPGLWLGDERPTTARPVLSSGSVTLDAVLPGGGWPMGSLTEVLQWQAGQHEWRLLLPAVLRAGQRGQVLLIGAPHSPCLPLLSALGLPHGRITCLRTESAQQRLWSTEQALRCPDVAALLVWLPQARPEALRRLHLAAQACCPDGVPDFSAPLLFAMRPWDAGQASSPAPLRLTLEGQGRKGLAVQILKRPGPPVADAVPVTGELPVLHLLPPPTPSAARNHLATATLPASASHEVAGTRGHNVLVFPSRHAVDRLHPNASRHAHAGH